MKKKLRSQIDKMIGDEIQSGDIHEDMSPTMSQIYSWGLRNITIKEMQKIIKENKKFNGGK